MKGKRGSNSVFPKKNGKLVVQIFAFRINTRSPCCGGSGKACYEQQLLFDADYERAGV